MSPTLAFAHCAQIAAHGARVPTFYFLHILTDSQSYIFAAFKWTRARRAALGIRQMKSSNTNRGLACKSFSIRNIGGHYGRAMTAPTQVSPYPVAAGSPAKYGHERTPENLRKNGGCIICHRARSAAAHVHVANRTFRKGIPWTKERRTACKVQTHCKTWTRTDSREPDATNAMANLL